MMRIWIKRAALAGMAASLAAGCANQQRPEQGHAGAGHETMSRVKTSDAQPVEVLRQVHGSDPSLSDQGVRLLKSRDAFNALHAKRLEGLNVNWSHQAVVLFTMGQQSTGGYWANIDSIQQVGSKLWISATANAPGHNASQTQVVTYPYAAAVIAKPGASQAMLDVRSVSGQPLPGKERGGGQGSAGGKPTEGVMPQKSGQASAERTTGETQSKGHGASESGTEQPQNPNGEMTNQGEPGQEAGPQSAGQTSPSTPPRPRGSSQPQQPRSHQAPQHPQPQMPPPAQSSSPSPSQNPQPPMPPSRPRQQQGNQPGANPEEGPRPEPITPSDYHDATQKSTGNQNASSGEKRSEQPIFK